MKKNYMAPQCEQVVLNVSEEILDGHFGNQSGVPVEPSTGGSGTQGNTGSGVDGFEARKVNGEKSIIHRGKISITR